jgi:hypothetical protein
VAHLDADFVENDTVPCQVTTWGKTEMILQARMCLKQEKVSVEDNVEMMESDTQELFEALIKGKRGTFVLKSIFLQFVFSPPLENQIENVTEAQETFVKLLEKLPVVVLDKYLEKAARFCSQQLKWTSYEPLVDYICTRHPLAGDLFSYTSIRPMKSLISMEQ